jgi:transcriptional regulator with XRE-family HTH domain
MFEPLPDVIRLRRIQRNLTQEQLARLAGVSRRQLFLLEHGHNVSLLFLLKVTRVLELTELPVDALRLRAAPPELAALVVAADAVTTAKRVIGEVTGLAGQLADAAASIDSLLERALSNAGPSGAIADAADHLATLPPDERSHAGRTLRELTTAPPVRTRARKAKSQPPNARARKRAR